MTEEKKQIVEKVNTDSIELTKNSKGFNWVIKAYGDDHRQIERKLRHLKAVAEGLAGTE